MNNIIEIERLEALLAGRSAEYKIFGETEEDTAKDMLIKQKIHELKIEDKSVPPTNPR